MNKEKLKRIKLILDLIKKGKASEPDEDTFEFTFEDFIPEKAKPVLKGITNLATEIEQISLHHLFEIVQKKTGENVKFVFPKSEKISRGTFGLSPLEIRETCRPRFYVHINDLKKIGELYQEIEDQLRKLPPLYLKVGSKKEGKLYRIDEKGKELFYQMKRGKIRYQLIRWLAEEKQYIPTEDLASELKRNTNWVRKTIGQIRGLIKKKLKVPGDRVIEGESYKGYRIQNIKLEKK